MNTDKTPAPRITETEVQWIKRADGTEEPITITTEAYRYKKLARARTWVFFGRMDNDAAYPQYVYAPPGAVTAISNVPSVPGVEPMRYETPGDAVRAFLPVRGEEGVRIKHEVNHHTARVRVRLKAQLKEMT